MNSYVSRTARIRAFLRVLGYAGAAMLLMESTAMAAHKKPASVIKGHVAGGGVVSVKVSKGGSTRSNKSGFFSLKGVKLAGTHTLTFTKDHTKFTTTVDVPAGSKLTLSGVTLSGSEATSSEEDVSVEGTLTAVVCAATPATPDTITVTPSDGGTPVLMSFDPTTTTIIDESTGAEITDCGTLASTYVGAPVDAEGTVDPSGGVTATRIELNPDDQGEDEENTSFNGTVQSESCPGSIVVLLSDGTSVTVNISPATEIDIEGFSGSSAAACSDIPINAAVEVEGVPQPDGSVNATSIHVEEDEFEASGSIASTDCAVTPPSLSFTPDGGTAVTVTIQPTTEIEVGDNDSAACTDLTAGPAEVDGVTQPDGTVAATEIKQ